MSFYGRDSMKQHKSSLNKSVKMGKQKRQNLRLYVIEQTHTDVFQLRFYSPIHTQPYAIDQQ